MPGVTYRCDGCWMCPMVGHRWSCQNEGCRNFDLCDVCYNTTEEELFLRAPHTRKHEMMSIPIESSAGLSALPPRPKSGEAAKSGSVAFEASTVPLTGELSCSSNSMAPPKPAVMTKGGGGEDGEKTGSGEEEKTPLIPKLEEEDAILDLHPPSAAVKLTVGLLVWGEYAENASGFLIITLATLAVGSFGPWMVGAVFWLCNAVIFLEVALKLLRNWADAFGQVKCVDVASQWEAFRGLRWSLRMRVVAVVLEGVLYSLMWTQVWRIRVSDRRWRDNGVDSRWNPRMYELLIAACVSLTLHWVLGVWVLLWGVRLWVGAKLPSSQLIPGCSEKQFPLLIFCHFCFECWLVRPCQLLGYHLGSDSCCGRSCYCHSDSCREIALLVMMTHEFAWDMLNDLNPFQSPLALVSLTWYVHYRRHPLLRGSASRKADDCGLPPDWSLSLEQMADLVGTIASGYTRVGLTAQAWLLNEINKHGGDINQWHGDKMNLVEAILGMINEVANKDTIGPATEIVTRLLGSDMVKESLRRVNSKNRFQLFTVERYRTAKDITKWTKRVTFRITRILTTLKGQGKVEEAAELYLSALRVLKEVDVGRASLWVFLDTSAWVFQWKLRNMEEELKLVKRSFEKPKFYRRSFHLDCFAVWLRKVGQLDEALRLQEEAVQLSPNDEEYQENLRILKAAIERAESIRTGKGRAGDGSGGASSQAGDVTASKSGASEPDPAVCLEIIEDGSESDPAVCLEIVKDGSESPISDLERRMKAMPWSEDAVRLNRGHPEFQGNLQMLKAAIERAESGGMGPRAGYGDGGASAPVGDAMASTSAASGREPAVEITEERVESPIVDLEEIREATRTLKAVIDIADYARAGKVADQEQLQVVTI